MTDKFQQIKTEYQEILLKLADPAVLANAKELAALSQRKTQLEPSIALINAYEKASKDLADAKEMAKDHQMAEFAKEEVEKLEATILKLERELKTALTPQDPNDQKNAILEIRAGTGGDEAALFAGDLFKMYSKFAETAGFKISIMDSSPTPIGGFRDITFEISGPSAYGTFKYESGTHRVQRVPETESQGRIHTSAVTIAVLPEAEEVDIKINPQDIKIDVFRSSGPGGQGVNTTDSAVRVTHIPTGIQASCQDTRSQLKNREKALSILRARLFQNLQDEEAKKLGDERKIQIGSGDRSEKIRTYNFPQNRLTDHRIGYTSHSLDRMLEGNIGELIEKLKEENMKLLTKEA